MRSLVSLAVLLLVSGISLAADDEQNQKPVIESTETRLAALEENVQQLKEAQGRQNELIAQVVRREVQRAFAGLEKNDSGAVADPSGIERRLAAIEQRLTQIGTSEISSINSAMDTNPQAREDVFLATNGRLQVNNQMTTWTSLRINGTRWRFPPGISSIPIRFGHVHVILLDGNDSDDYGQKDWTRENGEHVLKISVSNRRPYAY